MLASIRESPSSRNFRHIHEAVTSINLAFTLVAFLMIGNHPISIFLFNMDRVLSRRLGLVAPRADFTYGYFAFLVPAGLLALLFWCLLMLFARTDLVQEFLCAAAGIVALGPCGIFTSCTTDLTWNKCRSGIRSRISHSTKCCLCCS